jgi:hypothetical protein
MRSWTTASFNYYRKVNSVSGHVIVKTCLSGLAAILAATAIYVNWRLRSLYKLLGDRVQRLTFTRFVQQLRYPSLSKNFAGYVDFQSGLPDELRMQVTAVQHLLRFFSWVAVGLMIIFVVSMAVLFSRGEHVR